MQEIQFEGVKVQIQKRLFQRSINLLIKPTGKVKVTAGKTVSVKSIISFLKSQKAWLLKNLQIIENEKSKYPAKKFIENEKFLFLGRSLPLIFKHHNKKRIKVKINQESILVFKNENLLFSEADLKKALMVFYKKSGIEVIGKVINEKSKLMNLFPKKISYRAQKTMWGSCSSEGSVSMNWKLIFSPPETLEYVVIHELAHLMHQDHSVKFWSLVEVYSPEYNLHKQWLSDHSREIESYKFS